MLQVTERAVDKLHQMRETSGLRPEQAISLSFREGALRFDIAKPGPEDQIVERQGDPVVTVSPAISEALDGAVLDYDDAPEARRFTFEQPQPSG